ncbi:MAG: cysteine desulfurase family protein [Vicinamibacterales bacterium]
MAQAPVYLDYHATTPVDPRVLEAMLPFFTEHFGNPASSTHSWGWKAQAAVEAARKDVASLIGATAREIVFTSGATESNNLALRGVAALTPPERRHIVVSAIEHKSVLEVAAALGREGWRVSVVPVHRSGLVDLDALSSVVHGAAVVSVMAANNEIGTIQPLAAVSAIAHEAGALFHVDGAQAAGKIALDVGALGVDLLALTAHKIYGPKGCGALFVKRKTDLRPILLGGGHERGARAGTLNVPGIVGLGAASGLCRAEMAQDHARLAVMRDRLLGGLQALGGVTVNGTLESRLANNLHVSFEGVDGESLLIGIGDIAVSSSSACSSASGTPSHVLSALMGAEHVPAASVRFGLGRFTTDADIDYAIEKFSAVVRHLRMMAPA